LYFEKRVIAVNFKEFIRSVKELLASTDRLTFSNRPKLLIPKRIRRMPEMQKKNR